VPEFESPSSHTTVTGSPKIRKLDHNGIFEKATISSGHNLSALRKGDVDLRSVRKLDPNGRLERATVSTGGNFSALRKANTDLRKPNSSWKNDRDQNVLPAEEMSKTISVDNIGCARYKPGVYSILLTRLLLQGQATVDGFVREYRTPYRQTQRT
jgi:hypothetical protein